jgi:hypothetical protein
VQFVAENSIPALGIIGKGGQIINAGRAGVQGGNALTQAGRTLAVEAARRPGVTLAGEAGASLGAAVGGEGARDIAPDSTLGEVVGQTIGGLAGGFGAGGLAARFGRRPARPVVETEPQGVATPLGDDMPRRRIAGATRRVSVEAGLHGPVHRELAGNYRAAVDRLSADQAGEVPGALRHPEIGEIDLIWGDAERYGLAKIMARHPEVVEDLPAIVERLPVRGRPEETGNNRFVLEDDAHRAVIAPDFNGVEKRWLVTAFEKKGAPGDQTSRRDPLSPDGGSTGGGARGDILPSGGPDNGARQRDYIAVGDLPPLPPGFQLVDEPALGRVRPMGDRLPADDIAALARTVEPGDVTPRPGNLVESPDELPTSLAAIEAPSPGPRAKKPGGFIEYLRGVIRDDTARRGLPVRIDAEDAIDKGVPAELIYLNPTEADKAKLRLRTPSLFGTRYGKMSDTQQVLRSLDLDEVDPSIGALTISPVLAWNLRRGRSAASRSGR